MVTSLWFWGQLEGCKARQDCPGLGGFYLWCGSSYGCPAFGALSFNGCNIYCLSVRSLKDEHYKVTTFMKYAQAFRYSIF